MDVSQKLSRVRRSNVRAAIIGIIIYSAFYMIQMGIFTHTQIANFINSESFVALKVKLSKNDVILESDFININSSNEILSLFGHEVPLDVNCEDNIMSKDKSVTLVISHCHHPLHWVAEFLNGFEQLIYEVWVFTKCEMDVIGAPNGSKVFKLPNIGGCDHTYAHAMQMYADLPVNSDHDMVIFLKDTFEISMGISASEDFKDLLCKAEFYGLGCLPKGFPTKPVFHKLDILRAYTMTSWSRQGGSVISGNGTEVPFNNKNINSVGEWFDNLSLPIHPTQNIIMVCYGGNFATTKKQIMKKPMWVWKAIERSLSRGNNILEGHFAERAWASLLAKPLSNSTASKIWESQPDISEVNNFLKGMLTLNLKTLQMLE